MIEKSPPYVFPEGKQYSGEWKGNRIEGYGVMKWPDGASYEGFWKKNKMEGKGIFKHPARDYYEG